MIKVTIAGNKLIIDIQGLHKIWALKSRLEIPIEHIASVRGAADERVRAIAIELRDENFSTMIIEVPDPRASIREILNALGSWAIANV